MRNRMMPTKLAAVVAVILAAIASTTTGAVASHTASPRPCAFELRIGDVLPGQTWDDHRDSVADLMIETVNEAAPNFARSVLGRRALSPLDLEREFGLTEGNIFQGELSLEQLFFLRPVAGWAQFRTPIKNLYMCGSATHPGGGIMGAPGRLSALEILKDVKGAA